MSKILTLITCVLLTSCGSHTYKHGNYYHERHVMKKRENQRDDMQQQAAKYRKGTAKHYINEHKKHDGDINLFRRDGFDWGW